MKITRAVVTQFEQDQKDHGTKVALSNLLWLVASDLMTDLGVTRVRTTYQDKPEGWFGPHES